MTSKQQAAIKSSIFDTNSCLNEINKLIYFLITSLFTKPIAAQKRANLIIAVALTISYSIHHLIYQQLLLSLILVLKTMSLHQLLMSIHLKIP